MYFFLIDEVRNIKLLGFRLDIDINRKTGVNDRNKFYFVRLVLQPNDPHGQRVERLKLSYTLSGSGSSRVQYFPPSTTGLWRSNDVVNNDFEARLMSHTTTMECLRNRVEDNTSIRKTKYILHNDLCCVVSRSCHGRELSFTLLHKGLPGQLSPSKMASL